MTTLAFIFLLPLLAAGLLICVPRNYLVLHRFVAVVATFLGAVLATSLLLQFAGAPVDANGFRFVSTLPWLGAESLGMACKLGVDGLNVGLIWMGAMVAFAAACCSWDIQTREKEFYILLLVMTGGILGAFASTDLFFFYFFHELALVPTFIMIGVWGRGERKNYATFQITLYLSLGALIALAGLIALYLQAGGDTFDMAVLAERLRSQPLSAASQNCIFGLLLFGFGILVSLWPFHTWAPLGYGSAPTATAMLHAGVLKKFGLYALIRVAVPLLPEGAKCWMPVLVVLASGNILHVGWVAMRQRNLNLLIGNSSVAHMGFAFLGIASLSLVGVTGAVIVMIAHGLLAALAFALNGYLERHAGTLEMDRLGGLLRPMPFVGTVFIMAMLAGCGLPGFGNFVGEVMVLFGLWPTFPVATVITCWGGLIIGAVYMLRAVRAVMHGPKPERLTHLQDADRAWRRLPFVVLLAGLLALGCAPFWMTDKVAPAVRGILAPFDAGKTAVDTGHVPHVPRGVSPAAPANP